VRSIRRGEQPPEIASIAAGRAARALEAELEQPALEAHFRACHRTSVHSSV
jgi:hypothetical protein